MTAPNSSHGDVSGVCRRPSPSPYVNYYTQAASEPQPPAGAAKAEEVTAIKPAYSRDRDDWPKCVGKCMCGQCVLPHNHPECCYVTPEGGADPKDSYSGAGKPYSNGDADALSASAHGYWKSRNLFCPSTPRGMVTIDGSGNLRCLVFWKEEPCRQPTSRDDAFKAKAYQGQRLKPLNGF